MPTRLTITTWCRRARYMWACPSVPVCGLRATAVSVRASMAGWPQSRADGHQTEASNAQSSEQRAALSATSRNLIALVRQTQHNWKPNWNPNPNPNRCTNTRLPSAAEQTSHLACWLCCSNNNNNSSGTSETYSTAADQVSQVSGAVSRSYSIRRRPRQQQAGQANTTKAKAQSGNNKSLVPPRNPRWQNVKPGVDGVIQQDLSYITGALKSRDGVLK